MKYNIIIVIGYFSHLQINVGMNRLKIYDRPIIWL